MTAADPFETLVALVEEDGRAGVPKGLDAVVAALRERFGATVAAILFYGSCLRRGTLDGVIDVYVLVDDYRAAYDGPWLALANRLLPPNVFHVAVPAPSGALAVKVAVVSLARFESGVGARAFLPSLWARFAQPAAVVYARDGAIADHIGRLRARAVATALWHAARLAPPTVAPLDLWRIVLGATYAAELRAERAERADAIVMADAARYARLAGPALAAAGVVYRGVDGGLCLAVAPWDRRRARLAWALRRPIGKLVNVLRLAKAVFTFEGGADYLAWKIERHTGIRPELSPWQRRHPLLALPYAAWRLWRRGMVR